MIFSLAKAPLKDFSASLAKEKASKDSASCMIGSFFIFVMG